ncbi:hypothetical_protein [Leishmania braziliensis MHOM/BR/75/M2904]|uniref:Hypothetical_protein n=1 Tax=Leishmania braziliensis MHOM/BR/75/M2904 TaxID=420245 RepID=A0A3P3ZIG4_LEIBR|nr:hypothetical_protein [Leishmania braziliensis MHOM/BR/75/M2904]
MPTDTDSFSTYIDHLILLLAARFHASLNAPLEDLLSSDVNSSAEDHCPWELVARAVQQAVCTPQTAEERRLVRQLDVHHFSASVCRERARYMQWKLQESRCRRGDQQPLSRSPAVTPAALAKSDPTAAANATSSEQPCSVICNSLRNDVISLYTQVRQSLPSTLDGSESDDDMGGAQAPTPSAQPVVSAGEPSALAGIQEVFVRTPEEQERDELVARARDEFLSQVQALQSVYYDKYRRWMDVPASVLDPPPVSSKKPASTNGAVVASESTTQHGDSESEWAALLKDLGAAAPHPLRSMAQADRVNSSDVADRTARPHTVASIFRQVKLRRPLRPSAVSDDVLESMYRARAEALETPKSWSSASGLRSSAPGASTSMAPSFTGASADTTVAEAAALAPLSSQPSPSVAAIRKDTAPPVSRRGRWQIVEYDEGDDAEA